MDMVWLTVGSNLNGTKVKGRRY